MFNQKVLQMMMILDYLLTKPGYVYVVLGVNNRTFQ